MELREENEELRSRKREFESMDDMNLNDLTQGPKIAQLEGKMF